MKKRILILTLIAVMMFGTVLGCTNIDTNLSGMLADNKENYTSSSLPSEQNNYVFTRNNQFGPITYDDGELTDFAKYNNKSRLFTDYEDFRYNLNDLGERALYMLDQFDNVFGMSVGNNIGYREKTDGNAGAFNWPYGALMSMAVATVAANPENERAEGFLENSVATLERYLAYQDISANQYVFGDGNTHRAVMADTDFQASVPGTTMHNGKNVNNYLLHPEFLSDEMKYVMMHDLLWKRGIVGNKIEQQQDLMKNPYYDLNVVVDENYDHMDPNNKYEPHKEYLDLIDLNNLEMISEARYDVPNITLNGGVILNRGVNNVTGTNAFVLNETRWTSSRYYSCTLDRGKYGNPDAYYDDNIWCVIGLLESAKTLGYNKVIHGARRGDGTNSTSDYTILQKAELTMRYCLSGWTFHAGGGIRWKDTITASELGKNSCINGPSAMACGMFYEYYRDVENPYNKDGNAEQKELYQNFELLREQKKAFYLGWMNAILEWSKDMLRDPSDGLYYDNLTFNNDTGAIVRYATFKLTYGSGTYLSALSIASEIYRELYEAENAKATPDADRLSFYKKMQNDYRHDADETAVNAYSYFVNRDPSFYSNIDIWPIGKTHPWFSVYLVRGYFDYGRLFGAHNYMVNIKRTMDYAWLNARNYYGFIQFDWTGRSVKNDSKFYEVTLIDSAAGMEVTALVDHYFDINGHNLYN